MSCLVLNSETCLCCSVLFLSNCLDWISKIDQEEESWNYLVQSEVQSVR